MIRFFFLFAFFFFSKSILSQENAIPLYPTKSVFEKYHNDMVFLNNSMDKIDLLKDKLQNNTQTDSLHLYKLLNNIQLSFQKFTDLNARRLIGIDKNLASTVPIRGSEMTYLNKSFLVYKKFDQILNLFQNNLKKRFTKSQVSYSTNLLLDIELSRISFFYKNYHNVISNKRLRRVLNASDLTFETKDNELKKLAKKLLRKKNYRSIQKLAKKTTHYHSNDSSLYQLVQSTSYRKSRIKKNRKAIKKYFKHDYSHRVGQFFTHYVSGAIGNFAGLFRFRKGYLYKNDSIFLEVQKRLKPMDIITEKTGFTLTDKMIPGYFGHIAIWLGTEKQLKEIQLWEHPTIVPFQNRIKQGYSILETDRKGTHLKTLKDFFNIDEIAIASIIGFSELTRENKIILYENALAQLGKGYDFNFDVETSDKLVCSELLYQVFGAIHWPTDNYLKRNTISPDNVLSLALYKNTPISLTYYLGAKDRKDIYIKTLDDLAKDLGYTRKNNEYLIKGEKCTFNEIGKKKKCHKVYYPLEYQ
ncbi:MAG TPA: hypothetical protein EYG92_05525 [Lutibacter sp.]|nr:hypothetical protein [Lutibacter sp.]